MTNHRSVRASTGSPRFSLPFSLRFSSGPRRWASLPAVPAVVTVPEAGSGSPKNRNPRETLPHRLGRRFLRRMVATTFRRRPTVMKSSSCRSRPVFTCSIAIGSPRALGPYRGEMVLQFPTDSAPRHLPLQYQAVPPGVPEQDYVVAVVDIRELPDKETPISFEFADPSGPNKPNLSFNPVFTPSKIRPYVAKVLLTESDIDGINHQRICPVTGALLGSKGPIVKLYICRLSSVRIRPRLYCRSAGGPAKVSTRRKPAIDNLRAVGNVPV